MINSIELHKPKVAIIGGGISGLSTARQLNIRGFDTIVFDSGKREVGGRASTRVLDVLDKKKTGDHSAQFFYARNPTFNNIVQDMVISNYALQWNGMIGNLDNGEFQELSLKDNRYVGKDGITSISKYLSRGINTKIDTWVSRMSKTNTGRWQLHKYSTPLGEYDYVIIAHNGKCADRLVSTANISRIHDILKVNFGPNIRNPHEMKRMQLCSLWVGLFVFEQPLPLHFEGAYVKSDILSWICNTSKKLKQATDSLEVWTFISTREFGAANKVPQESIPIEKAQEISQILIQEFERCTGLPPNSVVPVHKKLQ
eukprot:gene6479-13081_t